MIVLRVTLTRVIFPPKVCSGGRCHLHGAAYKAGECLLCSVGCCTVGRPVFSQVASVCPGHLVLRCWEPCWCLKILPLVLTLTHCSDSLTAWRYGASLFRTPLLPSFSGREKTFAYRIWQNVQSVGNSAKQQCSQSGGELEDCKVLKLSTES